jgi:hypothetical protein
MILLAALIAAQLAPGCSALGHAVRCELPPPGSTTVVLPPPTLAAETPPQPRGPGEHARPAPHRTRQPAAAHRPRPALDADGIEAHVRSLTAIGDCTGARDFLIGLGQADQGRAQFDACVGLARPPGATIAGR